MIPLDRLQTSVGQPALTSVSEFRSATATTLMRESLILYSELAADMRVIGESDELLIRYGGIFGRRGLTSRRAEMIPSAGNANGS